MLPEKETIATLPSGWDLAHAIRLGIKPFAELGANSETLSGSQVDSPCSCPAIFEISPGIDATVSALARLHPTRELVISGTQYIIVYAIINDTAAILTVLYGAQKYL